MGKRYKEIYGCRFYEITVNSHQEGILMPTIGYLMRLKKQSLRSLRLVWKRPKSKPFFFRVPLFFFWVTLFFFRIIHYFFELSLIFSSYSLFFRVICYLFEFFIIFPSACIIFSSNFFFRVTLLFFSKLRRIKTHTIQLSW